jgi:hypothetical protein
MSEDEVKALRRIYSAMSRWVVEELMRDLAHDIEWNLPDALPWGGTHHGPDGIQAVAEIFQEHVDGLWADPDDSLTDGVPSRFHGYFDTGPIIAALEAMESQ